MKLSLISEQYNKPDSLISLNESEKFVWEMLAPLPNSEGFAGMYAGISNNTLFCMGGANFPEKKPWEGGVKKWHKDIFMFREEEWVRLTEQLPLALAYGVSISWNEKVFLIGGNTDGRHSKKVFSYSWKNDRLDSECYPDLPVSLANMAGTILGDLIIIVGGNSYPDGSALKKCYGLDLSDTRKGWIEFDTWPGPERVCPVCAAYNGIFYMFSGETTQTDSADEIHRLILRDAYSFRPIKYKGKWRGLWKKLADMPEGVSAGGSPLPVFGEGEILFFGGVDAKTAMHNDPVSHAGISNDMQIYLINTDTWKYAGKNEDTIARVTLPIVPWEGGWAYISGEIKPGIRTNSICVIR